VSSKFEILGQFRKEREASGDWPIRVGDAVRVLLGNLTDKLYIVDAHVAGQEGKMVSVVTEADEIHSVERPRVFNNNNR
jgi:hypothetical protein